MHIRAIQSSEIEAARRLLAANGWAQRVADAEQFRVLVSRSQRALVAVDNGEVIGFARALCDGISNGEAGIRALGSGNGGAAREMTTVPALATIALGLCAGFAAPPSVR